MGQLFIYGNEDLIKDLDQALEKSVS